MRRGYMQNIEGGITTDDLKKATAGGDSYIRTKNNVVVGLALRKDLNPDTPRVVIFGKGPRIQASAELLNLQGHAVPTYLKNGVNDWRYAGLYRAVCLSRTTSDIATYGASRPVDSVAGVLFLEEVDGPEVKVQGGIYGDAQSRKEIELAAIDFVTKVLQGRGFVVEDRQDDNCGYDLLAASEHKRLLVEVKGTDAPEPRFFLTRNEYQCSEVEKDWRLFIVTCARTKPFLHEYGVDEMRDSFTLDPLAWEATPSR